MSGADQFVTKDRLAIQIAQRMREAIRSGDWIGELPGIRPLMDRFGVSRPPVLEAMEILQEEGWIGPARSGRQREILSAEPVVSQGTLLYCREASSAMPTLTLRVDQGLEGWFVSKGIAPHTVLRDPRKPKEFQRALREVFGNTPSLTGVVSLDIPHAEVRGAIGPVCPLLLLGGRSIPDENCASIAASLTPMVKAALDHWFTRGVRRMAVVLGGVPPTTVKNLRHVAREAFAQAGQSYDDELHVIELEPGKIPATVRRVLRDTRPQLLLTIGEDHWARLHWEVSRIDPKVLVMNLWNSRLFHQFEQPPAVFELEVEDYTKALARWYRAIQNKTDYRFTKLVGAKLL